MAIAEIECRKLQNPKKMTSKKKQQEAAPKHELKDKIGYEKQIMSSAFFFLVLMSFFGWFTDGFT